MIQINLILVGLCIIVFFLQIFFSNFGEVTGTDYLFGTGITILLWYLLPYIWNHIDFTI